MWSSCLRRAQLSLEHALISARVALGLEGIVSTLTGFLGSAKATGLQSDRLISLWTAALMPFSYRLILASIS